MNICRHCKLNEGTIVDSKPIRNGIQYFYYTCRDCQSKRSRAYRKTLSGKSVYREIMKRQYKKHTKKVLARNILNKNIKLGNIIRPESCSRCETPCNVQAHHENYDEPLNVIWLCIKCHRMV